MTSLFVGLSLIFPRLTLVFCWFTGAMPPNGTPFEVDVFLAILAPRWLLAWWLWQDPAWHPAWSILFVLFSLSAGSGTTRHRAGSGTTRHRAKTPHRRSGGRS